MKMRSVFLQMLHEERQKEMKKGTKRRIIVAFLPELPQTVTQLMYIAADCCLQRDTVPGMFNVLL
jgi:hypothetical protein